MKRSRISGGKPAKMGIFDRNSRSTFPSATIDHTRVMWELYARDAEVGSGPLAAGFRPLGAGPSATSPRSASVCADAGPRAVSGDPGGPDGAAAAHPDRPRLPASGGGAGEVQRRSDGGAAGHRDLPGLRAGGAGLLALVAAGPAGRWCRLRGAPDDLRGHR